MTRDAVPTQPEGDDERGRRAKIPRVEEDRDPAPESALPSRPGTPAAGARTGYVAARTSSAAGARSVAGATSAAGDGSTAGPSTAVETTTACASGAGPSQPKPEVDVVDLTETDDEVKREPTEVDVSAQPTESGIDAVIGIAAESMLNAGMDAAAIRTAIARMRENHANRRRGGGSS